MRRLASLSLVIAVTGCSLVIDTSAYQGGDAARSDAGPDASPPDAGPDASTPDAGPDASTDGGFDAGFDAGPSAPSTPDIEITPTDPLSADDLEARIVTPSVDPLGMGAVTYEFSWNGGAVMGSRVTASMTSRGETWTVLVTPVTTDGRRGLVAMASVVIGDTPPTIVTVGLNDYRPPASDTLRAFVGPISDPDGDVAVPRFAWFRNDVAIAGETSNTLDLAALSAVAGDRIRVEATASGSGLDGNTVRSGDARVVADVARWRQVLPNRVFQMPSFSVYDEANRRIVFGSIVNSALDEMEVWEFALDPTVGGRFTKLHPTGPTPPLYGARAIYDPVARRVVLLGGVPDRDSGVWTNDVYQLDMSTRGAEAWSRLTTTGGPSPRTQMSVAFDARTQTGYAYGGRTRTGFDPIDEAWAIDLSVPGAGVWTRLTGPRPPIALFAPALLVDAPRDRLLLIGGVELGGVMASRGIYALDLSSPATGFALQTRSLPEGRAAMNTGITGDADVALLAFGFTASLTRANDAFALDLATLTATRFTPGSGSMEGSEAGFIAPSGDGRTIMLPGGPPFVGPAELDLYYVSPSALEPIHETGVNLPGSLSQALAQSDTIFGGVDQAGGVRDEVWRRTGTLFVNQRPSPDAVSGLSPSARANMVVDGSFAFGGSDLLFYGGEDASGLVANTTVWDLSSTPRWVDRGAGSLPARSGAMLFSPACGGNTLGVFGGRTASGIDDTTSTLDCTAPRSCSWTSRSGGPSARELGTVTRLVTGSVAVLFGGRDDSRDFGDLWSFDPCGSGWSLGTATGAGPSARSGHSATLRYRTAATFDEVIIFGGRSGSAELNDAFLLTGLTPTTYQWTPINPASGGMSELIPARTQHVAFYDRDVDRVYVYGGSSFVTWSDMWELRLP